jgi:hypothetical protein
MGTLQVVCGDQGGPIAGSNFFECNELKNAIVHFIIVNNVVENGLTPNSDYVADSVRGRVTRNNNWVLADKAIFVITKCNC